MQKEPLEYLENGPKMEEPIIQEIKRVEGPGGAGRLRKDTQEVQVPQTQWTENPTGRRTLGVYVMLRRIPLQVGEEGVWYCFCSSSSTTEDSKGSAKDTSGSRNGEGLTDGSPGKTVREAGHAGSRLSAGGELRGKRRTEEES